MKQGDIEIKFGFNVKEMKDYVKRLRKLGVDLVYDFGFPSGVDCRRFKGFDEEEFIAVNFCGLINTMKNKLLEYAEKSG